MYTSCYCTKIFVIVVNKCVCRRSVDNKALILSYPLLQANISANKISLPQGQSYAEKK